MKKSRKSLYMKFYLIFIVVFLKNDKKMEKYVIMNSSDSVWQIQIGDDVYGKSNK